MLVSVLRVDRLAKRLYLLITSRGVWRDVRKHPRFAVRQGEFGPSFGVILVFRGGAIQVFLKPGQAHILHACSPPFH